MLRALKILLVLCLPSFFAVQAQSRIESDLSGKGWKLWYDKTAPWKDDELYLPTARLASITAAPPTGGWNRLTAPDVKDVSVPGTVEEY